MRTAFRHLAIAPVIILSSCGSQYLYLTEEQFKENIPIGTSESDLIKRMGKPCDTWTENESKFMNFENRRSGPSKIPNYFIVTIKDSKITKIQAITIHR